MLRGAQRCSSLLARQLAGRAATLTQSQMLPASIAPLAVLRTTLAADTAPAGAGAAFHSFQSQSIHTSVSLRVCTLQMMFTLCFQSTPLLITDSQRRMLMSLSS